MVHQTLPSFDGFYRFPVESGMVSRRFSPLEVSTIKNCGISINTPQPLVVQLSLACYYDLASIISIIIESHYFSNDSNLKSICLNYWLEYPYPSVVIHHLQVLKKVKIVIGISTELSFLPLFCFQLSLPKNYPPRWIVYDLLDYPLGIIQLSLSLESLITID